MVLSSSSLCSNFLIVCQSDDNLDKEDERLIDLPNARPPPPGPALRETM